VGPGPAQRDQFSTTSEWGARDRGEISPDAGPTGEGPSWAPAVPGWSQPEEGPGRSAHAEESSKEVGGAITGAEKALLEAQRQERQRLLRLSLPKQPKPEPVRRGPLPPTTAPWGMDKVEKYLQNTDVPFLVASMASSAQVAENDRSTSTNRLIRSRSTRLSFEERAAVEQGLPWGTPALHKAARAAEAQRKQKEKDEMRASLAKAQWTRWGNAERNTSKTMTVEEAIHRMSSSRHVLEELVPTDEPGLKGWCLRTCRACIWVS